MVKVAKRNPGLKSSKMVQGTYLNKKQLQVFSFLVHTGILWTAYLKLHNCPIITQLSQLPQKLKVDRKSLLYKITQLIEILPLGFIPRLYDLHILRYRIVQLSLNYYPINPIIWKTKGLMKKVCSTKLLSSSKQTI